MKRFHLEFPGNIESLCPVAEFVLKACNAVTSPPLPGELISAICLVASEAVTNAIMHGVRHEGDLLSVTIVVHDDMISVRVVDHGPGFDLDEVIPPDLDQPAESGYGIFVIKSLMDEVSYVRGDDANALIMIKRFGRKS